MKLANWSTIIIASCGALVLAILLVREVVAGLPVQQLAVIFSGFVAFLAFGIRAWRLLKEKRRTEEDYISRFDGKDFHAAVEAARNESLILPHGLVSAKVRVPQYRWVAFERDAFQFVIACDDAGKARCYLL